MCVVISCPMKRCVQTAEIVYPNRPLKIDSNLREFHFKQWEGQRYEDIKPMYQQYFDEAVDEQIQLYIEQTCLTFEKLAYDNADAFPLGIVTHGGQIKVILSRYVYPKRKFSLWKVKNGGVFTIDFDLKNKKASVLTLI